MNFRRALIPALFVLPVLVILALGFGKDPHALPFALEGDPMPAFELASLDGRSLGSASFAGKPLVINFWSTWCGPCKVEHEVLQHGARRYGERAQFVGIVYQDEPAAAEQYLQARSNVFPQLVDPSSRIAIEFGVSGVPETFFIDASGVVRHKEIGPVSMELLDEVLGRMLAAQGGP